MNLICSLKNINLSYGNKILFKDSHLQIGQGEKIGLIGLNGMGKSSLFKIILSELIPDISTPPFAFDKINQKSGNNHNFSVFSVHQKFILPSSEVSIKDYFFVYYPKLKQLYDRSLLLQKKIEEIPSDEYISEQENILTQLERLDFWKIQASYESYIKSFQLTDLEKDVRSLSGGEQRKILLALGLTSQASLILWDEPTNHLDMKTISLFEDEMVKSNKSQIIISHDRYLLSKVANRILHIHNSSLNSYKGSYSDYLDFLNIQEVNRKQTIKKLKNSLRREVEWMNQGIKARGTRSKKRVQSLEKLSQNVQFLKEQAKKSIELSFNHSNRKTKKLCEAINISLAYNGNELFSNLSFELKEGEKIGILGDNGVGKTSLIKIIAKRLNPTSGKIQYADNLKIQYFSQHRDEFSSSKSAYELLGAGEEYIHFKEGKSIHVSAYFQKFLFQKEDLHRPLQSFSGGELSRLQLALNLKNEADIWIFDEPTNDLDIESIEILENSLAKFKGTALIIGHDRTFLENTTNKIFLIKNNHLKIFTAGLSQVAPYLEVCDIEEEIKKEKEFQNSSIKKSNSEKQKIKNDKQTLIENLYFKIEKEEDKVKEIEGLLLKFNYQIPNEEQTSLRLSLNQKKVSIESKIEILFKELEKIENDLT